MQAALDAKRLSWQAWDGLPVDPKAIEEALHVIGIDYDPAKKTPKG